jgi:hypothetical protein
MPWPVIESPRFYTLFLGLKRGFDEQPVTHPAAGEFLHKLKMLMAKLKVSFLPHLVAKLTEIGHERLMIGGHLIVRITYWHMSLVFLNLSYRNTCFSPCTTIGDPSSECIPIWIY